MKAPALLPFLAALLIASSAAAAEDSAKPRVIVLTDLSNEPDDEEPLVPFLVYANEFQHEGLIATTSTHLKRNPREALLRRDLEAYAQVLPNSRSMRGPRADHERGTSEN